MCVSFTDNTIKSCFLKVCVVVGGLGNVCSLVSRCVLVLLMQEQS